MTSSSRVAGHKRHGNDRKGRMRHIAKCCVLISPALVAIMVAKLDLSSIIGAILFTRPNTAGCVPDDELGRPPAAALRSLTNDELETFARDGSVKLRGVLDEVWVGRLRALVQDCFEHPNMWDVLYSRLIANFYCAQKAILVHHTSLCGRQIAEAAPTNHLAAALLRSSTLRICEPTDALGN